VVTAQRDVEERHATDRDEALCTGGGEDRPRSAPTATGKKAR
jgi:hypothetical protein